MELSLRLAHLYPKQMNLYGDRGNILCLRRRCAVRGIELAVVELEVGERLDPTGGDLGFIGGGAGRGAGGGRPRTAAGGGTPPGGAPPPPPPTTPPPAAPPGRPPPP